MLQHNSAEGKGFPLRIRSEQVRVDDNNNQAMMDADQQVAFVKGVLPTLNWPALVQVSLPCLSSRATSNTVAVSFCFSLLFWTRVVGVQ